MKRLIILLIISSLSAIGYSQTPTPPVKDYQNQIDDINFRLKRDYQEKINDINFRMNKFVRNHNTGVMLLLLGVGASVIGFVSDEPVLAYGGTSVAFIGNLVILVAPYSLGYKGKKVNKGKKSKVKSTKQKQSKNNKLLDQLIK